MLQVCDIFILFHSNFSILVQLMSTRCKHLRPVCIYLHSNNNYNLFISHHNQSKTSKYSSDNLLLHFYAFRKSITQSQTATSDIKQSTVALHTAAVLLRCCSGATHYGATPVLLRCYCGATTVLLWTVRNCFNYKEQGCSNLTLLKEQACSNLTLLQRAGLFESDFTKKAGLFESDFTKKKTQACSNLTLLQRAGLLESDFTTKSRAVLI